MIEDPEAEAKFQYMLESGNLEYTASLAKKLGLMDGKRVNGLNLHLDTLATVSGITQYLTQGFNRITKEELPDICDKKLEREDEILKGRMKLLFDVVRVPHGRS